jgi:hypothetical protein|tara:strand:+ start:55 stop:387 length:333 start_codon:yes stop_codon:yes gene_type:complete
MSDKEVKESGEYDNFMDHIGETIHEAPSLADFVDVEDNRDNWEKHWVGMPTYVQEENKTYKSVVMHFRNAEDYKEFCELVGQAMTMKTKSAWYPALDREANSLLRWIEEE